MAEITNRAYGPAHLAATATTLFSVAAGKRLTIRYIHVQNGDTVERTFTLSVGTDAAGTRIFDAVTVPARTAYMFPVGITLEPTETLQGSASIASKIVLVVNGVLEDV